MKSSPIARADRAPDQSDSPSICPHFHSARYCETRERAFEDLSLMFLDITAETLGATMLDLLA